MMRRDLFLALLVVTAAGCAPTLAGQLRDPQGAVVSSREGRVNITSLNAPEGGDPHIVVAKVDDDGRFATSEPLAPGDYLVEALVPGYALTSSTIKLASGSTVDLTLKPLATGKAEAMRAQSGAGEDRGAGGATLMPPSL